MKRATVIGILTTVLGLYGTAAQNSQVPSPNPAPKAAPASVNVRQYVLDRTHSNSYQTWVGLGKPAKPSQAQWTQIGNAAELCYYQTTATGASWTATFPQNIYSVSLIVLSQS